MPYSIDRYNGTTLAVVEDGTIDTTTDIKLIGKNYAGYGEVQNENLVHMLENFSSPSAPSRPISGQIWYDSANKKLKFYDQAKWRTTGGAEISSTAPTGLTTGDFWWDTANDQLFAWDGAEFVLVGPQGAAGSGTTQMVSASVKAVGGASKPIIQATIDGIVQFIISKESFVLDTAVNPISGFTNIKEGVTLKGTLATGASLVDTPGVGLTGSQFWGTASSARGLIAADGSFVSASSFSRTDVPTLPTSVQRFNDVGLTVGASNDLEIFVVGDVGYIKNAVGSKIYFQTTASGTKTPIILDGPDFYPGTTATSSIGRTDLRYDKVWATTFEGTATQANTLLVSGTYRSAATTSTADTIVARDAASDIYANLFRGIATQARFADLAEKYLPDAEYDVGTVMMIGGEKEVTASIVGSRAIGVISSNPAFMMNSELEGGVYVALKGRVPVKVEGSVLKGQRLVAGSNGVAQVSFGTHLDVFAIAIETNSDVGIKLVECVII